ncbi:EAL domain-containing protein [Oceanimonas smirnovii]|uniref:EAL domain-containing protein n=1 Tax=Oceanimonas smirnovii TaxID=264574 RepID=UPI000361A3B7|nr:EAL domain-containing protein [Oceanimonas smirnovii]
MAAFHSSKIALLLFLLPVLLFVLAMPALISPLSTYLLEQKMREVTAYLDTRSQAVDNIITRQLAGLRFDCGLGDMALLREPKYYSRYIRMTGVSNAENISCSSVGMPFDSEYLQAPAADGFTLKNTPRYEGTDSELMVRYQMQGNIAFWVLDSSWVWELIERDCTGCFLLSFHYPGSGIDSLERGNTAIPREQGAMLIEQEKIQQHIGQPPVVNQQQLWGGQILQEHAQALLWRWGGGGSVVFSLILAAGYHHSRRYRNTIGGLIRQSVKDEDFIPYYQPVVDSRSQKVVGYEVLVRWKKGGELITPDQFIPAAETEGLVGEITMQLLNHVLHDLEQLDKTHWVSINLVAEHVETDCLFRWLQERQWPWSDRIKFELTERVPIKNLHHADKHITALIERGYQFKIDDFGVGYGGFVYLQKLNVEGIKIDKIFIDTIGTSDAKRRVLDSIIISAHQVNMSVIAEGVETFSQVDYLAQRHVYLIQGYVYYRPMAISSVLGLPERAQGATRSQPAE